MSTFSAEMDTDLEDELVEAYIDEVRESSGFQKFNPEESDIADVLHERPGITATTDARVVIYHVETGERRVIPRVFLRNTLRTRLPNGKRAFSLKPTITPFKGQVMCLLHPDHPDRSKWTAMGINEICGSPNGKPAGHIASEVDLEVHMAHKHSRAWARMKAIEDRRRDDEDRARQLEFMDRLTRNAVPESTTYVCPYDCGKSFPTGQGLKIHIGRDHK